VLRTAVAVFVATALVYQLTFRSSSDLALPSLSRRLLEKQNNKKKKKKAKSKKEDSLILVMGLPRSGSESIHHFFDCNGVPSAHYCCDETKKTRFPCDDVTCGECVHQNMLHFKPPLEGCSDGKTVVYSQFDVESGDPYSWFLPQHFTLPLLHEAYPDSIWILNRRDTAQQWADNVLHWFSVTNRILNSFGVPYHSAHHVTAELVRTAPVDSLGVEELDIELERSLQRANNRTEHDLRRDALVAIYEGHLRRVRSFARQYAHPLVELSVDDPNAATLLTKFFPTRGPKKECWTFDAQALDDDWKDFSLQL
jgi:hypothetical protein